MESYKKQKDILQGNTEFMHEEGVGQLYQTIKDYQNKAFDRYDLHTDTIWADTRTVDIDIKTTRTEFTPKAFDRDRLRV
jgi:hypothetical protein